MRKHIFTLKKQYLDSAACSNVLNVKKKYWEYKNWERHCSSCPRRPVQLKDAGTSRHGILGSAHRFQRGMQMERWENALVIVYQGLRFTQYQPSAKAAAATEQRT